VRLISAAPSNTEILFKLGKGGDIVATTSLCDYPKQAARKDSIGGWSENISIEKIVNKDPDIVFTSDSLQDEIKEKLEEKDIRTVHVAPESLEEVYDSIRKIGSAVNREEKAKNIVSDMKTALQEIDLQGAKIYCEEWSDPPMVSGNWFPEMIRECNGEYPIEKGRSRKIEQEEMEKFNPNLAVLNICGAGEQADRDEILEREDWQELDFVQQENVFVVNDSLLNRPGPRLVEGMKRIEELVSENCR
jgi:iron complex transport system substrate-binding protein